MASSVLAVSGNNAGADRALVEMQSCNDNTAVVARTAALLQRESDVLATNGTAGSCRVVLCNRGHLRVMTVGTVALGAVPTSVDPVHASTNTQGTPAQGSERHLGAVGR